MAPFLPQRLSLRRRRTKVFVSTFHCGARRFPDVDPLECRDFGRSNDPGIGRSRILIFDTVERFPWWTGPVEGLKEGHWRIRMTRALPWNCTALSWVTVMAANSFVHGPLVKNARPLVLCCRRCYAKASRIQGAQLQDISAQWHTNRSVLFLNDYDHRQFASGLSSLSTLVQLSSKLDDIPSALDEFWWRCTRTERELSMNIYRGWKK